MDIKYTLGTELTKEEYEREFKFHIRLLCSRFEIKLVVIAQNYIMANSLQRNHEYVSRLCVSVISRFGNLLLILPENERERDAKKNAARIKLLGYGIPNPSIEEILNMPLVLSYPFSLHEDPFDLHTYRLLHKMDSFIIQYFDSLTLERPEIYESDLDKSPNAIDRNIICHVDTTRESIVAQLLNMDAVEL